MNHAEKDFPQEGSLAETPSAARRYLWPRLLSLSTFFKKRESRLVRLHVGRMVGIILLAGSVLLSILQGYGVYALSELHRTHHMATLALSAEKLRGADLATIEQELERLVHTPSFRSASLHAQDGTPLLSRTRAPLSTSVFLALFSSPWVSAPLTYPIALKQDNENPHVFTLRLEPDSGFVATQIERTLFPLLTLTLSWLLTVALLLSFRMLRQVTDPLEALAKAIVKVDPKHPAKKPLPLPANHRKDEIGVVVRGTNYLLLHLEQALQREQKHIRAREAREVLFRGVVDHVLEGIVCLREDFRVIQANHHAAALLHHTGDDLTGNDFSLFLPPAAREAFIEALTELDVSSMPALATQTAHPVQTAQTAQAEQTAQTARNVPAQTLRVTLASHEGREDVHLDINATCYTIEGERFYVLTFRDARYTTKSVQALQVSEERLRCAVQATGCGAWDYDLESGTLWWTPEFMAALGYAPHEIPQTIDGKYALIHPEDLAWVKNSMSRFLGGDNAEYNPEYRIRRKDGTWVWVEERGILQKNEAGKVVRFLGAMMDCSERKKFERQLMYMATHDSLTDLPNRTLLQDRLEHAILSSKRNTLMVAVLLIDVDRFKLINDSLGHEIGDQLIRALAKRLQESMRPMDALCHLSADEFAVVCEDITAPQEAARVAKRLISAMHHPFTVDGTQLTLSVSVGISLSPTDGESAQSLLRNADTAMHNAKANGGNGYRFFVRDMNDAAVERLSMERRLALALETQQFRLHYQPKVDLETGALRSAEALIRWPQRDGKYIPPDQFIPIAEETGLVVAIGEWALREALSQICAWRDRGFIPVPVAVNLSGKHLVAGGMDELILRLLREYDVPPHLLEVELTESSLMEKIDKVMETLGRLRDAGVGIALDDFGTGYSSLSWLRQLPLTTLKIDRSFVMDIPEKPDANAIAAIILETGHQLGMKVVAEGIDTEAQRDFLRSRQCDYGQGWFFSRPLRASLFETKLEKKTADTRKN